MWDTVKGILGNVAPFLASTLGGPLAGSAVSKICGALGLTSQDPTPDAIAEAIAKASPEQLLALKEAEVKHQEFLAQLNVDSIDKLEALQVDDRKDARAREIATKDSTPRILAYLTLLAFVVAVFAVLLGWGKVETALAGTLIGYLSGEAKQVLAYYFGDSAGHAETRKLLADQTKDNTQ